MRLLSAAAAPLHSSSGFPHWMLWGLLIFFIASFIITVRSVRARKHPRPPADPWPGWSHPDGRDAADILTDPNLPAVEAEPIDGRVVSTVSWTEQMAVPAPAIEAYAAPVEVVEQWMSQYELDQRVESVLARADRVLAEQ